MKHKVYTVFDSKAEVYMLPFFARADGEATRMFKESIGSPQHRFASNPADYTLFRIGTYDDDTASYESELVHVNLGNGIQFRPEIIGGPDLAPAEVARRKLAADIADDLNGGV